MATLPSQSPEWWDREFDHAGRPIRKDVRACAHEIWKQARALARSVLGDDADAALMLETAVARVSHYLNQKKVPEGSVQIAPVLMRGFSWQVRTRHAMESRMEGTVDLDKVVGPANSADWSEEIHRRLDLGKVLRHLSPRSCRILLLRSADHTWKEIAKELGIPESTARNSFWRDQRNPVEV